MSEKISSFDVNVRIDVYQAKSLFFRQEVATGSLADGTPFSVDMNVSGDALLVRFGKEDWQVLSIGALMDALVEKRAKAGGT